jgi:ABC-type antimicrobial peptide transport system permease subunit
MGVPPEFQRRIPLTAGLPAAAGSAEALLGEIAAQKLSLGPGDSLQLDGRALRISGIFRTGSRLFDGGLMIDIPTAQRILARNEADPYYTLGLLSVRRQGAIAAEIESLNQSFPSLKAIPGTEFAGSLRLMRVVHAFVSTISVIAFLGTFLVVSNTLLMAISERTREIGILMAVGWTPMLVLRMLLAESMALCLAGALLGNLLALGLLRLLNQLESVGFGWIPVRFSPDLSAASLAMALMVALLALAWPAFVVFRMQPLAALRHE